MQKTRKVVVCLLLLLVCGIQPGACPVQSPLTLRELTIESEMIVTAKLNRVLSEDVAAGQRPLSPMRRWLLRLEHSVRTEFQVTQVVKGSFYVSSVEVVLSPEELETFPKDQPVLLFLARGATEREFVIAGTQSEGVKNKPEKEVAIYAQRIKELLTINAEREEAVRNPQLTEWLVQCVEEPVTRTDALDDLIRQHYSLRWQKEAAERAKEAAAEESEEADSEAEVAEAGPVEPQAEVADEEKAESAAAETTEAAFGDSPDTKSTTNLVALLTEAQKQRLLKILYQASRFGENEMMLVGIAEDWHDDNFIPFLWSYLKTNRVDEAFVVNRLMEQIAKPYPYNEEAQQMPQRYENAVNGIRESDNDENEESGKPVQPPANPQTVRAEFIRLIESLGPPRLVSINSETR